VAAPLVPSQPAKPKKLDPIDYRILEACLRNPEVSQQAIADAVGKSVRTVNRRVNTEAFQSELTARYAQRVDATVKICRANAPFAVRRLLDIVKSKTSENRDVIAAVRELNRIALETKVTVAFDNPLSVRHSIDADALKALSDEELAVLEKILSAGQAKGDVGA
jgi:DNA-binding Lrp family transcriptional regulator